MLERDNSEPGRVDEQVEWLTLGRAAQYLGVAQSTLRKWCDAGRVPAFTTPGGHRRFRKQDLQGFLQSSRPGSQRREGPSILVVDDEPGVRAYVRASLEPEGFLVEEATAAEEGLRLAEERAPNLIMIDASMPREDGWEMLRRLRERLGEEIPPVLMFSDLDQGDAQLARERGASDFYGKPLDPRLLVERARETVAG